MSVEETERGLGRATTTGGVTIAGGKQAGVDDGAGRRLHIRVFVIVSHVATSYSALMLPGQKRQRPGKLSPPGPLVRANSSLQLQATATQPWAREAPVQSRQQQQVASDNIVRRLWRSTLGVSIRSRRSILGCDARWIESDIGSAEDVAEAEGRHDHEVARAARRSVSRTASRHEMRPIARRHEVVLTDARGLGKKNAR